MGTGRQMLSYLAEDILSQVDDDTLMVADEVCQSWRQVIIQGCFLQKLLQRKLSTFCFYF